MEQIFKSLYYLENGEISIIEIEKTTLPANAEVYERFQWIKLDKLSNQITPLQFLSMKADEEHQERTFEGAYLEFSSACAIFNEDGYKEQKLNNNSKSEVSESTKQLIANYLAGEV